jgi:hypothetical protein
MVMSICKVYEYGAHKILMPLHSVKVVMWCAVNYWHERFLTNSEFRSVCKQYTSHFRTSERVIKYMCYKAWLKAEGGQFQHFSENVVCVIFFLQ